MGIDVGSTTVKVLILDSDKKIFFIRITSVSTRSNGTRSSGFCLMWKSSLQIRIAVCGSGGKPISDRIGAHFVRVVVANASAVCALYPQVRTAIELGGQDAKIIFFYSDNGSSSLLT